MRFKRVLFAVIGISLGMSAEAASFNCALASSRIDNAICASPQVSALDSELDAAYRAALVRNADQEALRVAQRSWLKTTRYKCQDDEACLVVVYRQRIAALNSSHPELTAAATSEAKAEAKANVEAEEAADKNLAMENAAAEASAQAQKAVAEAAAAAEQAEKLKVEAEKAAQALEQAKEAKRVAELEAARQKQILQIGGGAVVLCVLLVILLFRVLHRNRKAKASPSPEKVSPQPDASNLVLEPFAITPVDSGVEDKNPVPELAKMGAPDTIQKTLNVSQLAETTSSEPDEPKNPGAPIEESVEQKQQNNTAPSGIKKRILKYINALQGEIGGLYKSISQLFKDIKESEGGLGYESAKKFGKAFISNLTATQRVLLMGVSFVFIISIWPSRPKPFEIVNFPEEFYFGQSIAKLSKDFEKFTIKYTKKEIDAGKAVDCYDYKKIQRIPEPFDSMTVCYDKRGEMVIVTLGTPPDKDKYYEMQEFISKKLGFEGVDASRPKDDALLTSWIYKKNGILRQIVLQYVPGRLGYSEITGASIFKY